MRKLISIRIDPQIHQTAREMGLNISKTCENSLKQTIQRLTASNCQIKGEGMETVDWNGGPGPGFEPGRRAPQARRLTRLPHPGHVHASFLR